MSEHPLDRLDAFARGESSADERARIEEHLRSCEGCREELELVREGQEALLALKAPQAVDEEGWRALEAALAQSDAVRKRRSRVVPIAVAAAILAGVTMLAVFSAMSLVRKGRVVIEADGERSAPAVLEPGEFVESGDGALRLKLGALGQAEIGPGTRIGRVGSAPVPLKLRLERGSLRAVVSAPPRFFIVQTPHADAVDLGCAYELEIGEGGRGVLRVDAGKVALERAEGAERASAWRSVDVPAMFSCSILPGLGAGAPLRKDAPESLASLVRRAEAAPLSLQSADPASLLAARKADALTLLHLLGVVAPVARPDIRDRLDELVPAPSASALDGVLALDPPAIHAWSREIQDGG